MGDGAQAALIIGGTLITGAGLWAVVFDLGDFGMLGEVLVLVGVFILLAGVAAGFWGQD